MAAESEASSTATGEVPTGPPGRSLIAAVGHRFWRDRSVGPVWVDRLSQGEWPAHVHLDDYSFGALAMAQQLEAQQLEGQPFDRAVFVTGEVRDRKPGSLRFLRYREQHSAPEHIQACMAEAGSGVIAIDLLMVICEHFQVLPPETWVLEVEPGDAGWGDGLSPQVEDLYPRAEALLRSFAAGRPMEER